MIQRLLSACPMLRHTHTPLFFNRPWFCKERQHVQQNEYVSHPPLQLRVAICHILAKEIKLEVAGYSDSSWLVLSSCLSTNVMAGAKATIPQP